MFRLAPSTMMTLAAAALLAATASAQPGVLVFADVEHRGALLRTPGSAACAETEGSAECAPMEPFAAAAAVAALLRVTPVQPVDARASSRVRTFPCGRNTPDRRATWTIKREACPFFFFSLFEKTELFFSSPGSPSHRQTPKPPNSHRYNPCSTVTRRVVPVWCSWRVSPPRRRKR